MRVRDVMTTNPRSCRPADTAFMAASIMREMDRGHRSDHRERTEPPPDRRRDRSRLVFVGHRRGTRPHATPLKDCMVDTVFTCVPEDDGRSALTLMQDHQIRRILVVNKQRVLQGIVSFADLMQRMELPSSETHQAMKKATEAHTQTYRKTG